MKEQAIHPAVQPSQLPGPFEAGTTLELEVRRDYQGRRLDKYLAARLQQYSRSFLQRLIREGAVKVDNKAVKASYSIHKGDTITLEIPILEKEHLRPEDIPLDIIYEDEYLMLVNKPPDMVVHPASRYMSGTLVNALLFHCEKLSRGRGDSASRPYYKAGIVHRLDRDTSGVMLVIKSDAVHEDVARQFERRTVHKEYLALVEGDVELDSDQIELPIGRHTKDRLKMSVRHDEGGKEATSIYEVLERFGDFTLVKVMPRTGRTHQIRVHMKAIGHPIVADAAYNSRDCLYARDITGKGERPSTPDDEPPILERQALHAYRIEFFHPILKKRVSFQAELPEDMQRVLKLLRGRQRGKK
ncbi:MAG TPA: RluA family pseudouridine synthase [Candidatus Tripitaka sp. YC43]